MLHFVVHFYHNWKVCYNLLCMFFQTEKYATIYCACFSKSNSMHKRLLDCWVLGRIVLLRILIKGGLVVVRETALHWKNYIEHYIGLLQNGITHNVIFTTLDAENNNPVDKISIGVAIAKIKDGGIYWRPRRSKISVLVQCYINPPIRTTQALCLLLLWVSLWRLRVYKHLNPYTFPWDGIFLLLYYCIYRHCQPIQRMNLGQWIA